MKYALQGLKFAAIIYMTVACSKVEFRNPNGSSDKTKQAGGSIAPSDPAATEGTNSQTTNDGSNSHTTTATPPKPPSPTYYDETFAVKPATNKVDVYLIVDNSVSMDQELDKLATRLKGFTDFLSNSNLDWNCSKSP